MQSLLSLFKKTASTPGGRFGSGAAKTAAGSPLLPKAPDGGKRPPAPTGYGTTYIPPALTPASGPK